MARNVAGPPLQSRCRHPPVTTAHLPALVVHFLLPPGRYISQQYLNVLSHIDSPHPRTWHHAPSAHLPRRRIPARCRTFAAEASPPKLADPHCRTSATICCFVRTFATACRMHATSDASICMLSLPSLTSRKGSKQHRRSLWRTHGSRSQPHRRHTLVAASPPHARSRIATAAARLQPHRSITLASTLPSHTSTRNVPHRRHMLAAALQLRVVRTQALKHVKQLVALPDDLKPLRDIRSTSMTPAGANH